ncbi:MAG: hypothetical protein H0T84_13280 [Tatlockia sp.]|nr:hypothetical protein [Tatlockia sp.]
MPHFMVRKNQYKPQIFQNAPQTGKCFFYHLNTQGYPRLDNTVINYELSLIISQAEFIQLIQNITGNPHPTAPTPKYNYHLPKQNNCIDLNYCTNALGLPKSIKGYSLKTIGIAANYGANSADGNLLFLFNDNKNSSNEIAISIHIKYSAKRNNALNQLVSDLSKAVSQLNTQKWLWQLNISDDFNKLGYGVTRGPSEYLTYKNAYEQEVLDNSKVANLLGP